MRRGAVAPGTIKMQRAFDTIGKIRADLEALYRGKVRQTPCAVQAGSLEHTPEDSLQAAAAAVERSTAVKGDEPVPTMTWDHDAVLVVMPYTPSEKIRSLLARLRNSLCRLFAGPGASQQSDAMPEEALPALTISGSADFAAAEIAMLTGISQAQVDIAGATGYLATGPFELYGALISLFEAFDTFGEQDHALRNLVIHYEGARRFHQHRHARPGAPILKGDAQAYRVFMAELDKIPDLSSLAQARRRSVSMALGQGMTMGLARNSIEAALALAPLVKPLVEATANVMNLVSVVLGFVGNSLETAEGVSNFDIATEKKERHLAIAASVDSLDTRMTEGVRKLFGTASASLKRHFLGCADESEMDRRLAGVKTTKGGLGMVMFGALGTLALGLLVGVSGGTAGIVIGVGLAVVSIAYCICAAKRYRQIGQRARELEAMQRRAHKDMQDVGFHQMMGWWMDESQTYMEIEPGLYCSDGVRRPGTPPDLVDNPYYTLRFLARVLQLKAKREARKSAESMSRQESSEDCGEEERVHPSQFQRSYDVMDPDTQSIMEAMVEELLTNLGMSQTDIAALIRIAAEHPGDCVEVIERLLAPVLHLPYFSLA